MRAKQINEFEQGGDPLSKMGVGKESFQVKERVYNDLKNKGCSFWTSISGKTHEDQEKYLIDNIYEIKINITKLTNVGLKYTDIECYDINEFDIRSWKILDSNYVIGTCLTEEDAKHFIKCYTSFIINNRKLRYEKSSSFALGQSIDTNKKSTTDLLDNIEQNRKKYNNI